MTTTRDYYNRRIGQNGVPPRLTLEEVAGQIDAAYETLVANDYLQRSFGYCCVDAGPVPGLHGTDLRMELYLRTGIRISGSISEGIANADEVTLFTLIEFIYDHVAKPCAGEGHYHSFGGCGLHLNAHRDRFDEAPARQDWRDKVNAILKFYDDGYELSVNGEIVRLASRGMDRLIATAPSPTAEVSNAAKLANAVHTFQLGRSTREQRKQAVRELADILEFHRPAVKEHLSKDEDDLFNIANNFALRHHNLRQKDNYDDACLTWMFYVYLATTHLILGRIGGVDGFTAAAAKTSEQIELPADDDIPF
jgi:hypothetical protein